MDTLDAINQRRSVKAYDPSHRLDGPAVLKGGQLALSEVVVQDRFA